MPPIASVDVPASSANLGSGFDCFAVALSLKLRAELHEADEAGIVLNARGEGAPGPGDGESGGSNLLIRGFREGLRASMAPGAGAWRLEVSSMIPSARGLGSSAAAIVAGVVLGAAVGRRQVGADELLELAARLEGHPDNVAAALYGGFTVAVDDREAITLRRFRVPEAWIPVAFIPQAEAQTNDMRAALPATVAHAAAARQAGRSALLATAIMTSDAGLLAAAMADELHQPYRIPSLPGARELMESARERGAAGACLSGSGPTVLAICDSPAAAHAVEKGWNASGLPGMATRLRFDTTGARLEAAD